MNATHRHVADEEAQARPSKVSPRVIERPTQPISRPASRYLAGERVDARADVADQDQIGFSPRRPRCHGRLARRRHPRTQGRTLVVLARRSTA